MKKQAFTLVELIVVITILAILGTIGFISLQGYSAQARDTKRISDAKNLLNKVTLETTRGVSISELVEEDYDSEVIVAGSAVLSKVGRINFNSLRETEGDFKDPSTNEDYPIAYLKYNGGGIPQNFYEIATISEQNRTTRILGNYYKLDDRDSPSLFGEKYYDNSEVMIYDIPSRGGTGNNGGEVVVSCPENPTDESNFIFDSASKTITGYSEEGPKDVVIPCEIAGVEVEHIGENAFSNYRYYELKSVVIPSSVKSIGAWAFSINELTSVVIPSSVISIGDYAFEFNELTSVVIPNGITSIGEGVFSRNQLTSVVIPNGITSIGDWAFYENQLTSVVIPNGVTSIGESAFSWNQLTSIVIPSSVTSIGDYAFSKNQLISVVIPSGVTSIGEGVFSRNQLTSIVIPSSVTSIGESAFADNELTSVVIPNGVTSIGEEAFACNLIENVSLSDNLISIGDYSFAYNKIEEELIFTLEEELYEKLGGDVFYGVFAYNPIDETDEEGSCFPPE